MAQRVDQDALRRLIMSEANNGSADLISRVAGREKMSRQKVSYHVRKMVDEGWLEASGATRSRKYVPKVINHVNKEYVVTSDLEEHVPWQEDFQSLVTNAPTNVRAICEYGFTEIFNNVIDHSESKIARVWCDITKTHIKLNIFDEGIGIFKKIKDRLGLEHERHALLELAKGKFTTDPKRHSGEGIFFCSRIFDYFVIASGSLYYRHAEPDDDWMYDDFHEEPTMGTLVHMRIDRASMRKMGDVFDRFAGSEPDDYSFSSTHVPLRLANIGNENLVSRSQAKRVLTRFEKFREVMLDFEGVETIGQAFADEIFRVFVVAHPQTNIRMENANEQVMRMIRRAIAHAIEQKKQDKEA